MRNKMLHHLNFKLHVTLTEVAVEMAGAWTFREPRFRALTTPIATEFPRCSLFLLDPLADPEPTPDDSQDEEGSTESPSIFADADDEE